MTGSFVVTLNMNVKMPLVGALLCIESMLVSRHYCYMVINNACRRNFNVA